LSVVVILLVDYDALISNKFLDASLPTIKNSLVDSFLLSNIVITVVRLDLISSYRVCRVWLVFQL
jgi:hypothetical protein